MGGIILTLPSLHHLDKWAIDLCHYLFVTMRTPYIKCYRIKTSQFKRQMFPIAYEILKFDLPSKTNVGRYEDMKKIFNDGKLQNDVNYIEMVENPDTFAAKLKPKELLSALKLEVITPDEFKAKFKALGYLDKDTEMMVRMVQASKEPRRKIEDDDEEISTSI